MLVEKISLPLMAPERLAGEQMRNWYRERNFVIRPIVLVTTVDGTGTPNAAVKTNFMTVSSMKSYAFCCSPEHHTFRNVMATGEFVINVPTEDIMDKVLEAAKITEYPCPAGVNEIERAGLTPIQSEKVKPPRVKECVAHYECVLDWFRGGLIVGKVVAVSVDASLMSKPYERRMIAIGPGETAPPYSIVCKKEASKSW